MTTFPAIETYRAELRATTYTPLDDAELERVRQRYSDAHHSSAIEDIHPIPEQLAFYALMLEMRVPQDLANRYSRRFLQEQIIGPALARQNALGTGKLRA